MARSGLVGLKDIHVGIFEGDGEAYTNVVALPGALTAKITVNEASETYYSDDAPQQVVNGLESIEVEFEMAGLSMKERAMLLGQKITDGILEESSETIGQRPYIGLTFSAELSNGGSRLVSIPKIKFAPSEDEYNTKGDKIEMTNAKLKGSSVPLENGTYRIMTDVKIGSSEWDGSTVGDDGKIEIHAKGKEAFLKKIPQSTEEAKTELMKNA
ncbi:hypothetical protein GNF80_10015 [Clostridium perfringens]|nr:hypothetical protein [Clostridium perfringens]